MKFFKKALTLLLAITITFPLFLTGCKKDEENKDDNADSNSNGGGTSQEEVQQTSDFLLKNGKSSYKIVIPDDADADEVFAGKRLQGLFNEATNVLLPILSDSDIEKVDSNDAYILIGDNDFAVQNDIVPKQSDVKATGYTIQTIDKSVYIVGAQSTGTLFGVYNFLNRILNYDYYAADIYYIDKGVKELSLYDYKVTIVPDYEVNYASYPFLTTGELKNLSMYAETYAPVHGKTGHASLNYTLDDENDTTVALAMLNHPKWFSEKGEISEEDAAVNDDALFASVQLCYTAHGDSVEYEKLRERMAQNIINVIKANKNAINFNCSVSDNHKSCTCDACNVETQKYGTPSGSLVKMLNKVIETVDAWMESDEGKPYAREWSIGFYAYNEYANAPAKQVGNTYEAIDEEVVCDKRLVPVVAYVNADYTSPIEAEQNKPYKAQCDAWRSISTTAKMYVYAQNYNYYLIPYNMFGVLSNQYKYWKGTRMYLLGSNNAFGTGFDNLRVYLCSKLGVNVNADLEELIKNYFQNVYLDAGDIMYNLFNEYRTNEQRLKEKYPADFCSATSCYQKRFVNSKYYESTLFDKWRNDIELALDKIDYLKTEDITRYNKVYKMIISERVWINYFYWQTNKSNILYKTLESITNDLIHDIEYCGMAYTKEGPYVTTSTFISEMKTFLGEMQK